MSNGAATLATDQLEATSVEAGKRMAVYENGCGTTVPDTFETWPDGCAALPGTRTRCSSLVTSARAPAPENIMTFARVVFAIAGSWGIVVLTPLYWLRDVTGRAYVAPEQSVQFFYGFFAVALTWQLAFLAIAVNPARLRPMMILSVVEKFSYVITLAVLYQQARISNDDAMAAIPDLLLGVLFIAAFVKTKPRSGRAGAAGA